MKKTRKEYLDILRSLGGDSEGKKKAEEIIAASECYQDGKPISISFVPVFYDNMEVSRLRNICHMTHNILGKVIMHYIEDADYRSLFRFSKDAERLILLPCHYREPLPISRFDMFLDEDDGSFKFCEFNADGTADMSFSKTACLAVEASETFRKFSEAYEGDGIREFELFDSWVDEFLKTYHSDENAVGHPNVLITDFERYVTMSDITLFLEAFRRRGLEARFTDIGKLGFNGRELYDTSDGMAFQAVYRRAVTSDVLRHMDECGALIDAVEKGKVCLIGHFRTTVIHSKMINVALLNERTKEILSDEEWAFVREHVLPTYSYERKNPLISPEKLMADKQKWILKPADDYDAHGIFAGIDMTEAEWEQAAKSCLDHGYVAMKFHEPSEEAIALTSPREGPGGTDRYGITSWRSMTGLYSYNGNLAGFMNRMGSHGVISVHQGGIIVPPFRIDN